MSFAVGSVVNARNREWVVLPESSEDLLMVRPLGGTEEEITGILLPLETVTPASFALPDPNHLGDYRSCRMLRDALRLGFRSSAGPFRSFAKIAVEPRPYQLVPLLVALKQDPIRILIADDVGIGKTVEAALIARELLDRGEVTRLAVVCPPALAEQWQGELKNKFHIEAEVVLPGTASKLERNCRAHESLFDIYPYVVVSMDFIKTERRRDEFLRTCPELVIVDEAHTCAYGGETYGAKHKRHALIKGLAQNPNRHVLLVTATPHSGNEDAFRSLLTILNPEFQNLPLDLTGDQNKKHRERLAQFLVQRKRGDIRHFMKADTPFPSREEKEVTYGLTNEYQKLMSKVLSYAREVVTETESNYRHQRIQWWSILALLRSIASSPAAAAATLNTRSGLPTADTMEEADEMGRRTVLDLVDDDASESTDLAPGSDIEMEEDEKARNRRRLREMARIAEGLKGEKDAKLQDGIKIVKELLKDGYNPIVFCRFIPTAEYVKDALREKLPKDIAIEAVTGTLPPADRELRIAELGKAERRVLVATDCLSEGINLQEYFDAVVHYDLSWNPTRHEQREGRVDRYGQEEETVRVVTYYGVDNQIDGIILDVLLRKHKKIRTSLGISVPVPGNSESIVEAIFSGLLLRKGGNPDQMLLNFQEEMKPEQTRLLDEWDKCAEREKRSRTMFAQETIGKNVEEVQRELTAVQAALGAGVGLERFVRDAFVACHAMVTDGTPLVIDIKESPNALKDLLPNDCPDVIKARFGGTRRTKEINLIRTHPIVEGLASFVMDTAFEGGGETVAKRCGVIRTRQVARRTTSLLLRYRFHIVNTDRRGEQNLLAEDCQLVAFKGSPQNAVWIDQQKAEELLEVGPDANIAPDQAREMIRKMLEGVEWLCPQLNEFAELRGKELLDAHTRVRRVSDIRGVRQKIVPQFPVDILGLYIYLPVVLGG